MGQTLTEITGIQGILNRAMPIYLQDVDGGMCKALIKSHKAGLITFTERLHAEFYIDELMDYISLGFDDPDSFLLEMLAASGCEDTKATAVRIYQNWDQRMAILHEQTDIGAVA